MEGDALVNFAKTAAEYIGKSTTTVVAGIDQLADTIKGVSFGPADSAVDQTMDMVKGGIEVVQNQDPVVVGLVGLGALSLTGVVTLLVCGCGGGGGKGKSRGTARKKKSRSSKTKPTSNGVTTTASNSKASSGSRALPKGQSQATEAATKSKAKAKTVKKSAPKLTVETFVAKKSSGEPEKLTEASQEEGEAKGGKKRIRNKKPKAKKGAVNGTGSGAAAAVAGDELTGGAEAGGGGSAGGDALGYSGGEWQTAQSASAEGEWETVTHKKSRPRKDRTAEDANVIPGGL